MTTGGAGSGVAVVVVVGGGAAVVLVVGAVASSWSRATARWPSSAGAALGITAGRSPQPDAATTRRRSEATAVRHRRVARCTGLLDGSAACRR
jgi:hypothetical protein